MNTFTRLESEVRSYCRSFPVIFTKAKGHELIDENGHHYIDFLAGAGALNYGHNNPIFKKRMLEYIDSDSITHSLDLFTTAKRAFLEHFENIILKPRNLDYKIMFPGPTGTNAVESALKLARKVTRRKMILFCNNGFHGVTLGALAVTANQSKRAAAGVPLRDTFSIPFYGQFGEKGDTFESLDFHLENFPEKPAAIILETTQAEGGINVASVTWLKRLEQYVQKHNILLIVDDIQVGCGRTGPFFSFERAGLNPDFVCLSKSISGYGIPMSIVLIRPKLDCWQPGEHNGTFRGHNIAFVTATAALAEYWKTDSLSKMVLVKAEILEKRLQKIIKHYPALKGQHKGIGMIQGITCSPVHLANKISQESFKRGLVIETAGSQDEVLKVLPPLTIETNALIQGLDIIEESIAAVL